MRGQSRYQEQMKEVIEVILDLRKHEETEEDQKR